MNARITLAVATRVLHPAAPRPPHAGDAARAALPVLIAAVVDVRATRGGVGFDALGPPLLALFPFIVMFLVTSVTTLRERSSGTLERLLAMPMGKLDLLLGYALAFGARGRGAVGARRRASASRCSTSTSPGPVWMLVVVAVADAVLGTALGLFVSRVRADRVPGRAVHAGRRDPADPAVRAVRRRATRCPTCSRRLRRAAAVLRRRRDDRRCRRRPAGRLSAASTATSWSTSPVVVGVRARRRSPLGAATLRRRTGP